MTIRYVTVMRDKETFVALYSSATGTVFGPLFQDTDTADRFLRWVSPIDLLELSARQLELVHSGFLMGKQALVVLCEINRVPMYTVHEVGGEQ